MKRGKKKGISSMLAYAILIFLVLGLSTGTYIVLKDYTDPLSKVECPAHTSLYLYNHDFDVPGQINLTLKNDGYFNVSGFIASFSDNVNNAPITLLNATGEGENFPSGHWFFSSPIGPGKTGTAVFKGDKENIKILQIIPFIFNENGEKVICTQSFVKQTIKNKGAITDSTPPYFTGIGDISIYDNESLSYNINASDDVSFDCFFVNDTTNFRISCSGLLENITALNVREYYLNITINDSANNLNSIGMLVNVSETPLLLLFSELFNSTWDTTKTSSGSSGSSSITLPLESSGTYNFKVDWGDGTSSTITSWNSTEKTHTYLVPGVYNVSINGTIKGFRFNGIGDRLKLINIGSWGSLNLGNSGGYFYGTSNLNITATNILNLTGTTNMKQAFQQSGISKVPNMNNWDVSKVTDMSYMFYDADVFNQPLNNWDVSRVTTMNSMFYDTAVFNGNLSNWNVSSVTDMYWMFRRAMVFNGDVSNWNIGAPTMRGMFDQAKTFNRDISSWDVSRVTNMKQMFLISWAFNQDISNWNVSSVTDMSSMFQESWAFNQDISNWNVSKVTDMTYMFNRALSFNQDISNWNVSKVTNMYGMFYDADVFNQPLNNWDVSSVTNMRRMFRDADVFNQPLNNWDVSSVTDMEGMFQDSDSFNQDLSTWDVSRVTNMYGMFWNANAFNQNLGSWNVSSVTTMAYMFYGVTLSTSNYDSILIGWAGLPSLKSSVIFHGGGSKYCAGESARNYIISTYGWLITDGGKQC